MGLPLILALVIISVTWVSFNQNLWRQQAVIQHDTGQYYTYLPAFFYEKDIRLTFLKDTINQAQEWRYYAVNYTPEKNPVIKMSMGMAWSYLPLFAMAHVYAKAGGYAVDGFSPPYHFAIQFSSMLYYLLGLLFLWKLLRLRFDERTSAITLFLISFATNVFFYLTIITGMSHIVGFAFISMFIYYTVKWYETKAMRYILAIGLIGGYLTLVRPINFLVFLFFALYGLAAFKDLGERVRLFWKHKFALITMGVLAFLVVLPQLLYWRYITGHYFFNSYVGEHFFFTNPHIFKALFGFRKGWFIYTPIMIFAVIGFFNLRKHWSDLNASLILFLLVYVYIAFSWWCWWYGGSFSQRVMIDLYPFFAIPFAAFIADLNEQRKMVRRVSVTFLVVFTCLNLFQTMQAKYNIIHYDSMTMEAYIKAFGKTKKARDREKYLKHPDYEAIKAGSEEE